MKKGLLLSLLFTFATLHIFAQNQDFRSTLSVNAGFSAVGSLISIADDFSADTKSYAVPAIQLTYDKGIQKWFSIGLATSYQTMGIEYRGYEYMQDGETVTEDFKTSISRLNVGIRPLFHYGNISRIDMYSGLRVGVTNWSINTQSNDPNYDPENDVSFGNGINFAAQVILYGLRGYFTDNLGANFELALGSPHFASFGLNYRW